MKGRVRVNEGIDRTSNPESSGICSRPSTTAPALRPSASATRDALAPITSPVPVFSDLARAASTAGSTSSSSSTAVDVFESVFTPSSLSSRTYSDAFSDAAAVSVDAVASSTSDGAPADATTREDRRRRGRTTTRPPRAGATDLFDDDIARSRLFAEKVFVATTRGASAADGSAEAHAREIISLSGARVRGARGVGDARG